VGIPQVKRPKTLEGEPYKVLLEFYADVSGDRQLRAPSGRTYRVGKGINSRLRLAADDAEYFLRAYPKAFRIVRPEER